MRRFGHNIVVLWNYLVLPECSESTQHTDGVRYSILCCTKYSHSTVLQQRMLNVVWDCIVVRTSQKYAHAKQSRGHAFGGGGGGVQLGLPAAPTILCNSRRFAGQCDRSSLFQSIVHVFSCIVLCFPVLLLVHTRSLTWKHFIALETGKNLHRMVEIRLVHYNWLAYLTSEMALFANRALFCYIQLCRAQPVQRQAYLVTRTEE